MGNLYLNLMNFNNDKLAGVGFFFKRLISNIDFNQEEWDSFDHIIIFSNKKVDPKALFGFRNSCKVSIVNLPLAQYFLVRILYEQVFLPFFLLKAKGVFYSPTPAFPLAIKFFNKSLVVISTIHDMIPFRIKNKYSFFRGLYVKFLSLKSARLADKIITVSEFSKTDICEIAKIPSKKVSVVYNFIPELKYKISEITEPYFVTICTIEPGKNLENMLKGFHIFISNDRKYAHYKYKIIGQFGWNYDSILLLVKELGLEQRVDFLGYLSDDRKNSILSNCTGLIYLSRYEGFGIPPLEAMYFNKVSVVSNVSSLPEVVGSAGIIQDSDDTKMLAENLIQLVSNSEKYSSNILEQLRKFNPEIQIANFKRLILASV